MVQTVVTARARTDLDGIASAVWYAFFLNQSCWNKHYVVWFAGECQYEAKYVLQYLWLEKLFRPIESLDISEETTYILVDYSERNGISNLVVPEQVVEVIDHKSFPLYDEFPFAKFRIEYVWAAATLIAEQYYFTGTYLPEKIAVLLYSAIYSNTLHFLSAMSWFRDMRMKDWLEDKVSNRYKQIVHEMTMAKTSYAEEHIDTLLRDDDKLVLLDNWLFVDYLQIEVGDSSRLLSDIDYIQEALHTLHEEQSVLCLLHLHDISRNKTYILSNFEHMLWYLTHSWFPWTYYERYIELDTIMVRKDTIPLLKEILLRIGSSTILQQFLY